jgi:hypothetical protein
MVFRPPAAAGRESSLLSSAHTIHSLLSVLHRPSLGSRSRSAIAPERQWLERIFSAYSLTEDCTFRVDNVGNHLCTGSRSVDMLQQKMPEHTSQRDHNAAGTLFQVASTYRWRYFVRIMDMAQVLRIGQSKGNLKMGPYTYKKPRPKINSKINF